MGYFWDIMRRLRGLNWLMIGTVLMLLGTGCAFIYSACFVSAELPVRGLYRKQAMWAMAGGAVFVALALADYRHLGRLSWWLYGGSLVLLALVLVPFIGHRIYGARRWLMLFGDSGISIQPSEFAKLASVLVLAQVLGDPATDPRRPSTLFLSFAIVAAPAVLILLQPDLGTTMILVPVVFGMMFVAGVPKRWLGLLVLLGFLAVGTVVGLLLLPDKLGLEPATRDRLHHCTGLSDYQRDRVLVFLNVRKDPLGAGWNKLQSEIAVGSGGLWGKGFLQGTQNILGFLPRSVAPTDFIYSVISEERGFFGSVGVLLLFAILMGCVTRDGMGAADRFGRLLCVGVCLLLFAHVFVNIAMTVGLLPITGLPLPLISYGGTFMLVTLAALGMVQSVRLNAHRREPAGGSLSPFAGPAFRER